MHCHRKIHTQNACHNIPHWKTQKAFLQLPTINCKWQLLITKLQRECTWPGCRLKDGHAQCMGNTSRKPGTVRGTARPHFSLAIISVTIQLWIQVFLVISMYFNLRYIFVKSGTLPPGHPVYTECPRRNGQNFGRVFLMLNGYGDNGQRSLKLWQLLHTYWLPNTY